MENLSTTSKVTTGLVALGGLALATKYLLTQSKDHSSHIQSETPASRNAQEANRVQVNPYIEARNKRILNQRLITYIVVGAGNRGTVYGIYAAENPTIAKVVGVCEPNKYRREKFLKTHGQTIPTDNIFTDWKVLLEREKLADVAVITTPDAMHTDIAVGLAKLGYHILVEKPMAIKEEDCGLIAKTVHENNVILAVGHVMRYTPYTQKIKEIVSSGQIGEVVNMVHIEPVGHYHFAHSYVRGNWRNQEEATFSLMAKSCHDIDWIRYIMNAKCKKVSSFGSLKHFTKQNKPKEAEDAKRCLDCNIKDDCPYSATRVYLDRVKRGHVTWPVNIIVNAPPDVESVTDALRNGPYGRCAYECDNNVCDNQVVNMEFEGGITASFSMVAFSEEICVRKTRIYGTLGELECDGKTIRMVQFKDPTLTPKKIVPESDFTFSKMVGHGGGDWYLMDSFLAAVAFNNPSLILSGPEETLESHLLVFAAEKSRLENIVVTTDKLTSKYIN